jgi:Arc/MetJ family transcription regulator
MEQAFLVTDFKTKKDIVEQAFTELIQHRTRKDLADLRGRIMFADGYNHKTTREIK